MIIKNSKEFELALKAVLKTCPAKDVRLELNGVRFVKADSGLWLVSTNGAAMSIAEIKIEGDTLDSFSLSVDECKRVLSSMKSLRGPIGLGEIVDGIGFVFDKKPFGITPMTGTYPDWLASYQNATIGDDVRSDIINSKHMMDAMSAIKIVTDSKDKHFKCELQAKAGCWRAKAILPKSFESLISFETIVSYIKI